MPRPCPTFLAAVVAILACGVPVHPACADTNVAVETQTRPSPPPPPPAQPPLTLDAVQVNVTLDRARNALSPDTGTSQTVFNRDAIRQAPLGDATPLSQLLLQAPGVVQDSFGELHVRGDHANLQYRIDGILIPESIGGFGQVLDVRAIESLRFLTGSLPAQFGYRTAGVVDITTKSGAQLGHGGNLALQTGSFGTIEPAVELHGNRGRWSYYATADYLQDDKGIENPTSARTAIHDHTNQLRTFGYLAYVLNATTRAGLYFGSANNRFQIPNRPDQRPVYAYGDRQDFDSSALDERQREITRFGVLSLQGRIAETDYRVALGQRFTRVDFQPDVIGDLMFNGVASAVARRNRATTLQADFSTGIGAFHLLRFGLYANAERAAARNDSLVFPADAAGDQTSTVPYAVVDDYRKHAQTLGAYVQDQWQVADVLVVNYGVRADRVRAWVDEGQVSPRVGLVWNTIADTTVHAGYARYFTPPNTESIAPTAIALYAATTNQLPGRATGNVKSERAHYFDVGASRKFGSHVTFGVDAYDRYVTYLQDEGQFGAALVFSPFNYARGRVRGIEWSANLERGPWTGYLNLARSRAVGRGVISGQFNFDDDEIAYLDARWAHLDHDQRLSASGGLTYAIDADTRIGGDFLYGSGLRRGFANTAALPAYFQLNLGLSRSFRLRGGGRLHGRLAVINVLDQVYALRDGSGIGVGAPQFGPRRGLYLGAGREF